METLEPFNIIYQTAEDGLGDTVKPRLCLLYTSAVLFTYFVGLYIGIKVTLSNNTRQLL